MRVKPWLKPIEETIRAKRGVKVKLRSIVVHPDILPLDSPQKGKFTLEERAKVMAELPPEKKLERNLLAQALQSYRRDFPREERQPLSAWLDSFRQNYLKRVKTKTDYHFVVGYTGSQQKPKLVAYSTLQVSRPRADLPTPLALSEYVVVHPDYRRLGIFDALWNKRLEIARSAGAKWIIGEKEKWNAPEHREWDSLSRRAARGKLSANGLQRLKELEAIRNRIIIFSRYYRHLRVPYVDPSEHVSFEGNAGVLNRRGRLNPLWLFARDLHNSHRNSISGREARNLLTSLYRGPQDLRRSDADFIVRKLSPRIPATVKLGNPAELVDPKRFKKAA